MQKEDIDGEIKSILGRKSIIELTPIIIKKKDTSDKICYFFDTDDNASPFDINMAYDAGFDIVVPVSRMTADQVPKLVQDAIFSRKPKAPTTFFIGGSNVKEGELIAKAVKSSLVPPFECPVIIDPRGSHTTASAVVAMTIYITKKIYNISDFKGKKVVIFGAGPVGRIAAILGAKIGFNIYIVETWDKSNKEAIVNLAKELTREAGENVIPIKGIFAPNPEKRFDVAQNVDIIWSLAAAGIEILSEDLMKKLNGRKIVIDINLVPPYGVGGLKPKHYIDEIFPGIFGIGALALGKLKASSEGQILKEAANTKGLKIYDFNYAFEVAMNLLSNK
ncbi:MAG: methylene-tetrahydromethanopterin dehydrogenase N-terminal domain-containing protein [Promethearchaeota archaeon]